MFSLNARHTLFRRTGNVLALQRSKHTLPDLPYDYNALEPYISADIMKLHHSKHHQAYITNYSVTMEKMHEALQKSDISAQVALQPALKFNGGGHINHSIFWTNLAPVKSGGGDISNISSDLKAALNKEFGSMDNFFKTFSAKSVAVQGSGWCWLGYNKEKQRVEVGTTSNQDPCFATLGLVPLLGCDVWEHAYYLQYKNVRPDYLNAYWKVVNWKDVSNRLHKAKEW